MTSKIIYMITKY